MEVNNDKSWYWKPLNNPLEEAGFNYNAIGIALVLIVSQTRNSNKQNNEMAFIFQVQSIP